ncbi:hypothetical protein D0962_10000 [Leptolyngbyaceae cyanobacterium CCMR0082]|uniref:Uncharacterized protein n=1 Tax=Adonisia turfae CCMR0082 TaxID=2304604 RepID=A0A6M0S3J7_9CYAN|nr:hypothetical protein [Adonisia turfae]NEZ63109.1 hypothetical protein [Adonisia turfae CCMR0082]
MFGQSVSLSANSSEMGFGDNLSSQLLKLVRQRSVYMLENPAIANVQTYLCELRRFHKIYSPLDTLIKQACSLENTATDGHLKGLLTNILDGLESNYADVMSDILRSEKPFLSGDFGQDLEEYLWLIECSAKLTSTVILDELGIYRFLRGEGRLASENLQNYVDFFIQKVLPEEPEGSPFSPYYDYLSDALSYIAKEIYC